MVAGALKRTPPRKAAQREVSTPISLPAPTKGWNAREGLADMDPLDAVEMINYFPGTTSVSLRGGAQNYSSAISGQVETLIAYSGGANNQLLGITIGNTYSVNATTNVLATDTGDIIVTDRGEPIVMTVSLESSGFVATNARFQYVNFTTPAGSYVCMVNGQDRYAVYDGVTWHIDTDGAPYDITGVDSRSLIGVNNFKNRLWFVQDATLKAWYLPVNSIGGAAASLDMSSLCAEGGYLMAMGTWTLDAGYGVDDYAVWITNRGEVLVWRMTDPTDPNSIFLIGIWKIGAPIGRRCMTKWKGDLLIITHDGLVALAQALQSSRLDPRVNLTDKIQRAISQAISLYGANFGWETIAYPRENALVLNVPVMPGQNQVQFVMNTITGAWCQFDNWSANCWCLFEDELYFGGNNMIAQAWTGYADMGEPIEATVLQAFNYFGLKGRQKRWTMMRPTLLVNGVPSVQGDIKTDYDLSAPASNLNTVPIVGALFDVSAFDDAQFAPAPALANRWQGATGVGYAGAVRLASATDSFFVEWVSTELVMEGGSVL